MSVLNDLRTRGVEDIFITATDNLKGFTKTIRAVFPESQTQICVVHQIRNASRYIVWKDKKELTADMIPNDSNRINKIFLKKKRNLILRLRFFVRSGRDSIYIAL